MASRASLLEDFSSDGVVPGIQGRDRKDDRLCRCAMLLQIFRLYTGTGLLAFPYAVCCGGMWAGLVGVVVIGVLNTCTLHMLIRSKRTVEDIRRYKEGSLTLDLLVTDGDAAVLTFSDVVTEALGVPGKYIATSSIVLALLGLVTSYLIFVGQTLRDAFHSPSWSTVSAPGLPDRVNLFTVIAAAVVMPLCLMRNYNKVQWSGIVGNVALLAAIVRVSVAP